MGKEGLRFSVLGPLRCWRGDTELLLGSPRQRAVLAVLLLRRRRPVTAGELIDAVWGDEPPATAGAVLHTYISQLRRSLETRQGDSPDGRVIVSSPHGYALQGLHAGSLDLDDFEQRVVEADDLAARGEPARARDVLRTALAMGEGTPLAGIRGPFAEAERARLGELRMSVTEKCLELELECGRHREIVPELAALTAAHPLRERLRGLLMVALYRCDRQAESLAVYADIRQILDEQLGVEPGPSLQELHRHVLRNDPLLAQPAVETGVPTQPVVPAQLPADLADFTGRTAEITRLEATLRAAGRGTAVPVTVVTGMGGAGKTTLAVHAAHRVRDAFPDGQLYVDLRGVENDPVNPADVLAGFLRGLGSADAHVPPGLPERAAHYRSVLSGRRVLVVLDNAHDAEQVIPLLPGSAGCAVLVTSRSRLGTLHASDRVPVQSLDAETAAGLVSRVVGRDRVEAEQQAVRRLVALCGGLPLAVRIVAARLAVRPEWSIAETAGHLEDEQHRLAELRIEGLGVEATFWLGYRQLAEEQARAFRLLALPAPATLGLAEAAAVLDRPADEVERVVESLVDAGMLESPARGSYRYHDLVRLFARARAEDQESTAERDGALTRLLDLLLATTRNAYRLIRPGQTVPDHVRPTAAPGPAFTTEQQAYGWGAQHLTAALQVVEQTAAIDPGTAADLVLVLDPVLHAEFRWNDLVPVARTVLEHARRTGDRQAERRLGYMLGGALMQIEQLGAARELIDRALLLCADGTDEVTYAMTLNVLAILESRAGHGDRALEVYNLAMTAARTAGDEAVEALALGNVVQIRLDRGDADPALLHQAERQLAIYERLRDEHGTVMAHYRLGQVYRRLGRPADALAVHQQSLTALGPSGSPLMQAGSLVRSAEALLDMGAASLAAQYVRRGLALTRRLRWSRLEALAIRVHGDALAQLGDSAAAAAEWHRSIALFEKLGAASAAEQGRRRLEAMAEQPPRRQAS
ncbi:regulatory protein AfsR [Actinoplanes sp. NBRC 14428]|nr:regulatory protein AfsR [Actinoplanes sp. NBRC 14428]